MYTNRKQFARGGFSVIYSANHYQTGQEVVVKVVDVKAENFVFLIEELSNHRMIQHPNVVHFHEAYFLHQEKQLWVILEYMKGGSLYERILRMDQYPIREPEMAFVMQEVLKALNYLHCLGGVHRDIKSDNVFFTFPSKSTCGILTTFTRKRYCSGVTGVSSWQTLDLPLQRKIFRRRKLWWGASTGSLQRP